MILRAMNPDDTTDYRILDNNGRLVGRVLSSEGPPSLGPGAGTVLLRREHPAERLVPPA